MTSTDRTDAQTKAVFAIEPAVDGSGRDTAGLQKENEALKQELAEAREQQRSKPDLVVPPPVVHPLPR